MSRNPNRIAPFMNRLETLWKEECPDWRFGQLISNIQTYIGHDIFYLEEDEMMEFIENYFGKSSTRKSQ